MTDSILREPSQKFLDATTHTVSWFWKRMQSGELVLQPPFQRNAVWQVNQQAYLIDTILRGYPIPELYVQTIVDGQGDEQYVVVDGQQRIRACLAFLSNQYSLGDKSGDLEGAYFKELPDSLRAHIFAYKLVVRELPSLGEREVREIFGRLNRNNVVLNSQELRHATYWGEFISSMTKISQHDFWVSSGIFTSNDIRRMLDVEYVSELAIAHLFGLQNKKQSLDKYYANFELEFPDRKNLEKVFRTVLGELTQILDWPTDTRWSTKTDFYSLFVLLAKHAGEMPFDAGRRDDLRERLASFATQVSAYLASVEDPPEHATAEVRAFARGVRASSDLGSRRLRQMALESVLFGEPFLIPDDLQVDDMGDGIG